MKIVNKLNKKGYRGHTGTRRKKPWEKFGWKMTKNGLESGSIEERERERKAFWKVWNNEEHVKKLILKNSLNDFWLVEN